MQASRIKSDLTQPLLDPPPSYHQTLYPSVPNSNPFIQLAPLSNDKLVELVEAPIQKVPDYDQIKYPTLSKFFDKKNKINIKKAYRQALVDENFKDWCKYANLSSGYKKIPLQPKKVRQMVYKNIGQILKATGDELNNIIETIQAVTKSKFILKQKKNIIRFLNHPNLIKLTQILKFEINGDLKNGEKYFKIITSKENRLQILQSLSPVENINWEAKKVVFNYLIKITDFTLFCEMMDHLKLKKMERAHLIIYLLQKTDIINEDQQFATLLDQVPVDYLYSVKKIPNGSNTTRFYKTKEKIPPKSLRYFTILYSQNPVASERLKKILLDPEFDINFMVTTPLIQTFLKYRDMDLFKTALTRSDINLSYNQNYLLKYAIKDGNREAIGLIQSHPNFISVEEYQKLEYQYLNEDDDSSSSYSYTYSYDDD